MPSTGLHWNVLDETLIRWRSHPAGTAHSGSLPQLLAALAANEVRDFPALRPHQRHPWHAFLVQLAAIALHHAGQSEPWHDAQDWRAALLALTPDDPDGAAWCLVAPPHRPALLQAPVPGGIADWDTDIRAPDRMDMIGTSKNHDLKRARAGQANANDWFFALVSLQTQAGSNSGSYKGISRMNSGAGSRPSIGVSQQSAAFSQRWRDDAIALLRAREAIADTYELPAHGGLSLLWLVPWDGKDSLNFQTLDPCYIEICRRLRLEMREGSVFARTTKTPASRIQENEARKGRTGDFWTPIDKEGEKIMAVPRQGFGYQLVTKLFIEAGHFEPAPAQALLHSNSAAPLELVCKGIAPDGNSKTSGYHERRVPISPKLRKKIAGDQRPLVAGQAKRRIEAISAMRGLLKDALYLLFENGLPQVQGKKKNPTSDDRASRFAQPFEQQEDARFFDDLNVQIEAESEEQEDAVYLAWLLGLAARAQAVLTNAFHAGPRSAMQRYKAQSAALSRFHAGLRGGKKPLFPELVAHYAAQHESAHPTPCSTPSSQGDASCSTPQNPQLPPQQLSLL